MISDNQIRPFDFIMLFWGQRYREYFIELCLPSLLAPQNLPLLKAEDGHRFLIATTKADWHFIKDLPIINRMREHTTPVWIEINEPENTSTDSIYAIRNEYSAYGLVSQKVGGSRVSCRCLWLYAFTGCPCFRRVGLLVARFCTGRLSFGALSFSPAN